MRSGRASVATSQSTTCRPSSSSRTPPPTRYAAWPLRHSVDSTWLTGAGALTGANGSIELVLGRSVLAEEEIVAPGLVARVGKVRREQGVDVAARLERGVQQAHARLIHQPATLAVVAVLARRDEVVPGVRAAAVARDDVVKGQVVRLCAAVLA